MPYLPDEPAEIDLLARESVVMTVAQCVGRIKTPGCIAVYGPWGSGKTTFLRHLEKHLEPARLEGLSVAHSSVVRFSPWEYERTGDVVAGLILRLTREARQRNGGARFEDLAKLAAAVITPLMQRGLANLVSANTGFGSEGALAGIQTVARVFEGLEAVDAVERSKASFKELVGELIKTLEQGNDDRLVILLDDLDRCLPASVIEIIEATKLLLCASEAPVVFVFALDREIVGDAIRAKLNDISTYAGEEYLEKIFDLSFELSPPLTIEPMVRQLLEKLPSKEMFERTTTTGQHRRPWIDVISSVAGDPVFANPRVLKRGITRLGLLADYGHLTDCKPLDHADLSRFVAWVLGAERFRTFRRFLFTASAVELAAVHKAAIGTEASAGPRLDHLVRQPLFRRFYGQLLGFEAVTVSQVVRAQTTNRVDAGSGQILTPLSAERAMRACGL